MNVTKSVLSAAIAAAGLFALLQPVEATTVVKRDHRKPPIVRDHREKPVVRDHRERPVVRDHRGQEGRIHPTRSPRIICASWAC